METPGGGWGNCMLRESTCIRVLRPPQRWRISVSSSQNLCGSTPASGATPLFTGPTTKTIFAASPCTSVLLHPQARLSVWEIPLHGPGSREQVSPNLTGRQTHHVSAAPTHPITLKTHGLCACVWPFNSAPSLVSLDENTGVREPSVCVCGGGLFPPRAAHLVQYGPNMP